MIPRIEDDQSLVASVGEGAVVAVAAALASSNVEVRNLSSPTAWQLINIQRYGVHARRCSQPLFR
jgi:hypothetical protein